MKRLIILLSLGILTYQISSAQTGIAKAQAMFIYNFSRLIEWPENYKTGTFVIGVIGSPELAAELTSYTTGKKVGLQDIVIKQYKDHFEIDRCQILFISFAKSKSLSDAAAFLQNKSTLLISEKTGSIEAGSAINFSIVGDKLKFEISPANANKYGIKMSSKLNEMAVKVY
ncbi:MAG: YfiR family protein [Bacteroidales bacterium]|nr:YfiR family protein [Bacteroidales bacterium]